MENAYSHDDFQVSRDTNWNDILLFFKNHHKIEAPIKVELKDETATDEGGLKRELLTQHLYIYNIFISTIAIHLCQVFHLYAYIRIATYVYTYIIYNVAIM